MTPRRSRGTSRCCGRWWIRSHRSGADGLLVMKAIDLTKSSLTLAEILDLAGEDNVILITSDGRRFVLAEMDDFNEEISRTCQNAELMQLLDERSRETTTFT